MGSARIYLICCCYNVIDLSLFFFSPKKPSPRCIPSPTLKPPNSPAVNIQILVTVDEGI